MNSSSCVTLRLLVHPVDRHGTLQVSGRSRDASGPDELAHHVKQPGRPLTGQQLRVHGNAARVEPGELVDGHESRLTARPLPE